MEFFSDKELRCKGSGELAMDPLFMQKLIALRREYNKPIVITSGYRSASYNEMIGGAKGSAHLLGRAVDIQCDGREAYQLMMLAVKLGFTGFGVAQSKSGGRFLHIDDMPIGPLRPTIWSY